MTRLSLLVVLLAFVAGRAEAQQPDPKKAESAARATGRHLRSHVVPALGAGWNDFALRVADKVGEAEYGTTAGWEEWADGTPTPYVTITRATLTALAGNEDALAVVLAHEHARLILGLIPLKDKPPSDATDDEADLYAVKLVLKAGCSVRKGLAGMAPIPEKSRPAWLARFSKLLDKPDESLWRSMPAFENGLIFLAVEDHATANQCFEAVTREFPTAHDAWANLGYARLLWYFDQFPDRKFSILWAGHFAGVSPSIRRDNARSHDQNRWWAAITALMHAEKLSPGQPTVLANLGLAFLIDRNGEPPFDESEKYLTAARDALKKKSNPLPAGEIELLVNLAVVRIAAKKTADARKLLDEATALAAKFPSGPPAQFVRAITFNRALVLVADDKASEAAKLFVRFLQMTPRFDPWWSEGYRHYEGLCKTLKMKSQSRDDLQPQAETRRQSVILATDQVVRPGDDAEELLNHLPKPTRQTAISPRSGILRAQFPAQGVELICHPDDVISIAVAVSKTAVVPWPMPGRYAAPVGDLRVGMTRAAVESLPGGTDFALRPFAPRAETCAYYPPWELAVIYDRPGKDAVVTAVLVGPGLR